MRRTAAPHTKVERYVEATLQVRGAGDALPAGVCGRISAVALTFNAVDTYGTMFAPGCAARSIGQRVSARKVPFLMDHDRAVRAHVGVVATMEELGDSYVMVADLLDTEDGRRALDYAKAVIAAGASTGVSIGFIPRKSDWTKVGDRQIELFSEIEIREISLTPMPAVPGADVLSARRDPADADPLAAVRDDVTLLTVAARAALDALPVETRRELLQQYAASLPAAPPASPSAPAATDEAPAPDTRGRVATMDERLLAVRQSFAPAR